MLLSSVVALLNDTLQRFGKQPAGLTQSIRHGAGFGLQQASLIRSENCTAYPPGGKTGRKTGYVCPARRHNRHLQYRVEALEAEAEDSRRRQAALRNDQARRSIFG